MVFVWTDEEIELLINVVTEYKIQKNLAIEGGKTVFWDSLPSKYTDIIEAYLKAYQEKLDQKCEGKLNFFNPSIRKCKKTALDSFYILILCKSFS